jgi:hypothetical protein
MIKFWKKKKVLVLSSTTDHPGTSSPQTVEKTYDEVCDELTEDDIVKIEGISPGGTRLVCICNYNPRYSNYNNIRDFLKYRTEYTFNVGKVYEVSYINNDIIYILEDVNRGRVNMQPFWVIKYSSRNPYIFDYFMLESDYIMMERNKAIEQLI